MSQCDVLREKEAHDNQCFFITEFFIFLSSNAQNFKWMLFDAKKYMNNYGGHQIADLNSFSKNLKTQ